jgi:hypothetical protein
MIVMKCSRDTSMQWWPYYLSSLFIFAATAMALVMLAKWKLSVSYW